MRVFALVGKPNVGKSTLFNKLARRRIAIVNEQPGVTRDRNTAVINYRGYHFMLVDTGGFDPDSKEVITQKMKEQSRLAVEEADGIIFLLDKYLGWTPQDQDIYNYLRRSKKPIYFTVNKIDNQKHLDEISEFYESGAERIFPISGEHNRGINTLLEAMGEDFEEIRSENEAKKADDILSIAIVGRQNAGKSSIVNHLLGETKQLVDNAPGTTRDPVDNFCKHYGQTFRLIDTAGIKRKSRVSLIIDKYSIIAAIKSIERADVVLLIIDATEVVVEQDARIAGYVLERGKSMIIVVNKWDLVKKDSKTLGRIRGKIKDQLSFVSYAPIIFVSAKTGQRVSTILEKVKTVYQQYSKRIRTADINRIVQTIVSRHTPPSRGHRKTKIFYAAQVAVCPPSFAIMTNNPDGINLSYQRVVTNQFRHYFGFTGTPIKIFWREKSKKSPIEET